jgi:UDP-N-acetylmuramoyl-L-alanyl-D-glutamate--2,6-diaminopimelate ligase
VDAQISGLLAWLGSEGIRVSGLAVDSRAIAPGEVFLAYPGARSDGRRFVADAVSRGAAAVLWEKDGFEWPAGVDVPNRAVSGLQALAGPLAHEVYGRPSERLWTMGITGTNGKTSCSHWLAQACTLSGARTAVVGTLGIGFPAMPGESSGELEPLANTTPEAVALHSGLARLLATGAQGVAMEVSSIGLDQGRANGIAFGAALFTNLSRDHLDYHADMEAYARAKQKLFSTPGLRHAVLNLDDVQGIQIARQLAGSGVHRIGYSIFEGVAERSGLDSCVQARDLRVTAEGLAFAVETSWGASRVHSRLLGRFNASNLLGVLGMMLASGVPFEAAVSALEKLQPVAGRMQRLGGNGKPLVVVDYAHTPDALQQTLGALRDVATSTGGELVAVFGCGGERDRGKRALMGAVASRHADRVVVTSDNPRGEQPEAIVADVVTGIEGDYTVETDRREAVARTIAEAAPRDVILLAGKGHEDYQEIGGRKLAYSDLEQAARALEGWAR